MAKLIKLRVAPKKNLLKKALEFTAPNRVITRAAQAKKHERMRELNDDIAEAKALVKDFFSARERIMHTSILRGEERAEQKLIAEVLKTCGQLSLGLAAEANSIDLLARRVAANITNRADVGEALGDEVVPTSLNTMLRIVIKAPASVHDALALVIDEVSHKINTTIVIEELPEHLAELCVVIGEKEASLSCLPHSLLPGLRRLI